MQRGRRVSKTAGLALSHPDCHLLPPAPEWVAKAHFFAPLLSQVFWPGQPRPVFFVASRGHHADIGGITPGSMPPHSRSLQEEGAVFISFKLVKSGIFQEEGTSLVLG